MTSFYIQYRQTKCKQPTLHNTKRNINNTNLRDIINKMKKMQTHNAQDARQSINVSISNTILTMCTTQNKSKPSVCIRVVPGWPGIHYKTKTITSWKCTGQIQKLQTCKAFFWHRTCLKSDGQLIFKRQWIHQVTSVSNCFVRHASTLLVVSLRSPRSLRVYSLSYGFVYVRCTVLSFLLVAIRSAGLD